jgi:putative membrane protein
MAKRLALLICLAVAALLVPAAPAAAAPSRVDVQFLRAAHETNLAQIDGGRLAQRRGASKQVRDLGAKFVTDHTRLDRALRQAATLLDVVLPTAPAEGQQTVVDGYATAPTDRFDALFIATQLDVHTAAIRLTAAQLAGGTDAKAVKAAKDLMPVLRSHYDALNATALELDLPSQHTIEPTEQPTGAPTAMTIMVLLAIGLIAAAGRAYRPGAGRRRAGAAGAEDHTTAGAGDTATVSATAGNPDPPAS